MMSHAESGMPWHLSFWVNGQQNGPAYLWNGEGRLLLVSSWADGAPNGTWTKWGRDGAKISEWRFEAGTLVGK